MEKKKLDEQKNLHLQKFIKKPFIITRKNKQERNIF